MNKKTLILGGILLVLIVSAYLYQGPLKKWQSNLDKPKNILAKIDTAKIDKIEVVSGNNIVVLTKQDGVSVTAKWKYNNSKDFYADPSIMTKVMDSLNQAKTANFELTSNSQDRKSEFKTDSTGLTVKLYQSDKKIVEFIVGSGNYGGSYIATADSPATYSTKADLTGAFTVVEWRDLTIFSTAKEIINKIRFQYPNREFTVELKDGKWNGILPEKFSVNQDKINKISETMANLKAKAIPEQDFKNTGLEKHLIIMEASGDTTDNILMIGAASLNGLYYAKRGDSDNIYLIDKATKEELDKWISQLK